VRPDAGPDGHGPAEVDQPAALLDVQLDEAPDAAQRLLIPSDVRGLLSGRRHCLGHGHPLAVTQPQGVIPRKRAGQHPRPGAGDAEPRAFLVAEVHDADRPRRPQSGCAQRIDREQTADHAERPVEGAAVGHGVQVRADDDSRS
jgi:hypothetical protein